LAAVPVTALVPYHSDRETFHGERTVHHLELVGTVTHQPFRDQGHEIRAPLLVIFDDQHYGTRCRERGPSTPSVGGLSSPHTKDNGPHSDPGGYQHPALDRHAKTLNPSTSICTAASPGRAGGEPRQPENVLLLYFFHRASVGGLFHFVLWCDPVVDSYRYLLA
jgi:hypothetical protein